MVQYTRAILVNNMAHNTVEEEWCITESGQGETVVELDYMLFEKEVEKVMKKEGSVLDCGGCLRDCYWQHRQAAHWAMAIIIVFMFIILFLLLEQLLTTRPERF